MSELIKKHDNRATIRWKLLTSVSAAALIASAYGAGDALAAEEASHPLFWIELGGQFQQLGNTQEKFDPFFVDNLAQNGVRSPLSLETPPRFGPEMDGALSFQPEDSDWIFSASIRYGRTGMHRSSHQQTPNKQIRVGFILPPTFGSAYFGPKYYYPASHVKFADASANESETHMILDFQAGKDVGLGLFGKESKGVMSLGVRIAQFRSRSQASMRMEPDVNYGSGPITSLLGLLEFRSFSTFQFHDYAAMLNERASFSGIGPSLSWKASTPLAGNLNSGELTLDWSANAALLFGKQKAKGNHQTTARTYVKQGYVSAFTGYAHFNTKSLTTHPYATPHDRSRSVTVPNLGATIGLSWRVQNFKASLGYRADIFFNAMDGGIDTRKSENRAFYGPYASISVGIP